MTPIRVGFVLRMAAREARGAPRRLGLLAASVAVGVAALVAINGFADNVRDSVRRQARSLLGADVAISSRQPLPAAVDTLLDTLRRTPGAGAARLTNFAAMAYVPRTTGARLVQISAVDGPYPLYGDVTTDPARAWAELDGGRGAIVDPPLLAALDARVGDTLVLGDAKFTIAGTVTRAPGNTGLRSAFGPRVFIPARLLADTRLLGFGARVEYEAFAKLPSGAAAERLATSLRSRLRADRVRVRTPTDDSADTNRALTRLTAYLGLIALVALLLGGVGVASAVTVFVRQRLETVAVLRCLGATGRQVLAVYLIEAALLGVAGSALGALVGAALQRVLPHVLAGMLPVDIQATISWRALGLGMSMGLWIAIVFALLPLLPVRLVTPLAALRRAYEETRPPRDRMRWLAGAALAVTTVVLAALQVGSWRRGAAFAGGVAIALAILWLVAWTLVRLLRRRPPAALPFAWRQGITNLHHPANQTVTIVLAIGLGAFLLATLFVVQHNLLRQLELTGGPRRPNLVLFDIQPDQLPAVERQLRDAGVSNTPPVPIVPTRIVSIRGRPVARLLADSGRDTSGAGGPQGAWALRREYRSTYRDTLVASERVVAGRWWARRRSAAAAAAAGPTEISVESGVASELGVHVGDEIVWDVQGVTVPTRVTSLRDVEWARFEPNFFVVFASGALEAAPQSFVTLARIDRADERGRFQRQLAERFANISTLDLTLVQESLERLLSRVVLAIRVTALFTLATGVLVLVAALATSRFQRVREGALLRTLGATRGQVFRIALVEYAALGALAAMAAAMTSVVAGWLLARHVFGIPFAVPVAGLAARIVGAIALTAAVGIANSRDVVSRSPLATLRDE